MENLTESSSSSGSMQILFSWYDYTLFTLMLAFSALIGIYFGFFGKKQSSPDEYLLGGKEMKVVPIALSLIASTISGITLLAVPTDVYRFGAAYSLYSVTVILVLIATYFIYVPVFYKLQITSTYEYIQLRFNANLRILASMLFTISTMLYLPIVIYIPALAFSQATGINLHLITPLVCGICIFYTTIGGLKAVVWTDALQFMVMIGAILGVFYMGLVSAGGFGEVWQKSSAGGRIAFDLSMDPTKRDTFLALFIGSFFNMASYIAIGQGTVQKFMSLPSMPHIKRSMFYFVFGGSTITAITVFTGLIMYAKYSDCDPFSAGKITQHDQILPYYVLDVSRNIPGLAGLFLSGLFSAALSTLSACMNCLSGTIYEDFVLPFMPADITKKSASNILKVIVIIIGVICTALVFIVEHMGSILPIQFALSGITAGPLFGIFTLGMLFPMANSRGAFVGTVGSLILMAYIIIQSKIYEARGLVNYQPKVTSIAGCESNLNITLPYDTFSPVNTSIMDTDEPFFLFRLSFYYYTMLGTLFVILIGVPASLILASKDEKNQRPVSKDVLSPVVHWAVKSDEKLNSIYYTVAKANSIVYPEKK